MNGARTLARALDLLHSLAADEECRPLAWHAAELGIPLSTAHRLAATLVNRGLIARLGHGRYIRSGALADLAGQPLRHDNLAAIARAPITRLSRETNFASHLGVWDQDMVQYLIRVAPPGSALFTREGERLEGYCSAIGKILLAHMPKAACRAYLEHGPFVPLTPHTITDPKQFRTELSSIRSMNIATDRQEVAEGLYCIASPVRRRDGRVIAAISLSGSEGVRLAEHWLQGCAETLSQLLG